jgi:hypothetical protein
MLNEISDSLVKRIYLIHLAYRPCPFLPMPSKHRIPMAINTKGYTGVLESLFEVMGF